jgi:deoxycytidine triphosphate deaminase
MDGKEPFGKAIPFIRGCFYLAHTEEFIGTTSKPFHWDGKEHYLTSQFDTRSTLARMGLPMHCSAGFGDCGFHGRWALEITPQRTHMLSKGTRIGQVYFTTLVGKPSSFYESNYSKVEDWSFDSCVLPSTRL